MSTERIIITFNQDGSWRGASSTDFGGQPLPLSLSDLSSVCPDLNTALLATISELEAKLAASENPNAVSPEPVITGISKLAVRRKLRELGYESMLDDFLNADNLRLKDWNDAQILSLSDALLVSVIPDFAAISGLSEAQIKDLLNSCIA